MPETPLPESPPAARAAPRGLLTAGIEALRTRLDLAAVELEIQVLVLLRLLAWLFAALTCVLLALAFGVVAIIVTLWDSHRTLGLLAGSAVFVGLGLLLGYLGLRGVRQRPGPFANSLQQLAEDERHVGGGP